MNSLQNQDRATRLAVFLDDTWLAPVPKSDRFGELTRDTVAVRRGIHPERLTVLKACEDHPEVAAVDCLLCAPDE